MSDKKNDPTAEGRAAKESGKSDACKASTDDSPSQDQRDLPGANSDRSDYLPGAAYQPSQHRLSWLLEELLELLRERDSITRSDVPSHLAFCLPQYIHALRQKGYVIDTIPAEAGDCRFARYVLVGEPEG